MQHSFLRSAQVLLRMFLFVTGCCCLRCTTSSVVGPQQKGPWGVSRVRLLQTKQLEIFVGRLRIARVDGVKWVRGTSTPAVPSPPHPLRTGTAPVGIQSGDLPSSNPLPPTTRPPPAPPLVPWGTSLNMANALPKVTLVASVDYTGLEVGSLSLSQTRVPGALS